MKENTAKGFSQSIKKRRCTSDSGQGSIAYKKIGVLSAIYSYYNEI